MYRFFLIFLTVCTQLGAEAAGSLALDDQIHAGFSYLNEENLEKAEQLFKGLQSSDNPSIQNFGHLGMAKLAIHEKRYSDAKILLEKLDKDKLVPLELKQEWILAECDLALAQGQYESCLNWLKKADPKSAKTAHSTVKAYVGMAESTPHLETRLKALNLAESYLSEPDRALFFITKARLLESPDSLLEAAPYLDDKNIKVVEALILEGSDFALELASKMTEDTLLQSQILAKKGKYREAIHLLKENSSPPLFLIATYLYQDKKYAEALIAFQELKTPEAFYWTARCKEELKDKTYRENYQTFYTKFPAHPLAAEAYLNCYTPQDYLLGEKEALKHLTAFSGKFPKSPLLLHASYYIGLDQLHDRKSFEGKWISRQNLIGAIESFQKVETLFKDLEKTQDITHLIPLRNQAILERAKTNLKIAEQSKPAKKAIYLDYASEVFKELLSNLNSSDPIYDETLYFLALTEIQSGKPDLALKTLDSLTENSPYSAKGIYQKAQLQESIELLDQALQMGKKTLSNDEILQIMLAKADLYRKEGKLDEAMLQLSEVVNYSTASSLRIKAMFLRAEIYREQGRKVLAQKQLESIALKGGEWSIKAKEQLDKYHGFE